LVFLVLFCPLVSPFVNHTYNLDSYMPDHLAIMFSMSWFGIPSSDPQGAGPDPSYGNWQWGGGCVELNNPAECNNITSSLQRWIASYRRPLAGIYSSSGRDNEGLARVDLMLSNLRRPCDDGAKLDAWSVQIDSILFTSKYPENPQSTTADIAYRAMNAFLSEADKGNMTNVFIPGADSTWYFNFGSYFGLGKCDNSPNNSVQNCINAIQSDLVDMLEIGLEHNSTYLINQKPVIFYYLDPTNLSPTQWNTLLNTVRQQVGFDFYVIGSTEFGTYFEAFDALCPWVNLGIWNESLGNSTYERAMNWVTTEHYDLLNSVENYPGRVVFGGVAPGFDDYTKDWGECIVRDIPRVPDVLEAQFDYLKKINIKGVVLETFDDWTEGTALEPDVVDGPAKLVQVRQLLGMLYGEEPDPEGDTRLADRWINYGQARNCNGGTHGIPPVINLISNCTIVSNSTVTGDSTVWKGSFAILMISTLFIFFFSEKKY